MFRTNWLTALAGAVLVAVVTGAMTSGATAKDIELSFYFPVAVGGPITKIIDGYAADFEKENPGIKVNPIYAGTYQDTLTKALTAIKAAIRRRSRCCWRRTCSR